MNIVGTALLAVLAGFLTALLLVPVAQHLALVWGLLDRPGPRKAQRLPVPLLGGAAVALALVLAVLLAAGGWSPTLRWFSAAAVLPALGTVLVLGLVDDRFKDRLQPGWKLCSQGVAVVLLAWEPVVGILGFPPSGSGLLMLLFLSIWLLALMNAFNMVDNMNGLCAGLAAISFVVLLVGAIRQGRHDLALAAGAGCGATVGFLPFNYPRARIYLGDGGSYWLGLLAGVLAVELAAGGPPAAPLRWDDLLLASLLLGLPLFDLVFSVVGRLLEGRPVMHGDTRHLSHRLVGAGLSPARAVALLWTLHALLAGSGLLLLEVSSGFRLLVFAGWAVLLLGAGILLFRRANAGNGERTR